MSCDNSGDVTLPAQSTNRLINLKGSSLYALFSSIRKISMFSMVGALICRYGNYMDQGKNRVDVKVRVSVKSSFKLSIKYPSLAECNPTP